MESDSAVSKAAVMAALMAVLSVVGWAGGTVVTMVTHSAVPSVAKKVV